MDYQESVHPRDVQQYDTDRLREAFLNTNLMQVGTLHWVYTMYDRFMYGSAIPTSKPLQLKTLDALKADFFLERRELGILNTGGPGRVVTDGTTHEVDHLDVLYVGKGVRDVVFESNDPGTPAAYYLNSTPAHHTYPTTKATQAEANRVDLGDQEHANKRTIFQYIHEDGIQSCQLVMGWTELAPGNIWNTFPPHTHLRRMEVYFYFDLPQDQMVLHFMGEPTQSRHIAMRNHDAILSPPWSIHAGAGTAAYKFAWGMGGENKAFTDMDPVALDDFK